jgi:hypothetical protein
MLEVLKGAMELLSRDSEISTEVAVVQALGFYPLSQSLTNFQV